MDHQCSRPRRKNDPDGQALAEYLITIPPILFAALGVVYLFREAWAALFNRLLFLLSPLP